MTDTTTMNILQSRAIAIAVAAREQVLAAARLEIERLRTSIDTIEPDVAESVAELCDAVRADTAYAVLDRVALAVRALAQPTAGAQLLTAIADVYGEFFSRVLVGAAEADGFTVWHSRGFDPPLHRNAVLRAPSDSPLTSATASWDGASAPAPTGVLGTTVRFAIALPLVARGRGAAMVYAENLEDSGADDRLAATVATILAETVRPRLHMKSSPTPVQKTEATAPKIDPVAQAEELAAQSKQRQARRVKMLDDTSVVVDEAKGTLVDLSTLGAQVLSPYALSPNTPVRIVLPHDAGGVACAGRVVWVIVEQHPGSQSALYRAGVQFTDVKAGELEGYLEFFDAAAIRH